MRRPKYGPCVSAYVPSLDLSTSLLASVDIERSNQVSLHSTAARPAQTSSNSRSVQEILRSWPNPDLWKNLKCDDDGWWIKTALIEGTLIVAADGSHQEEIDPDVCSCAFKLLCFKTYKSLSCTWAEKTEEATNYRGEILGAIGYMLVMKAVVPTLDRDEQIEIPLPQMIAIHDNMGVINHMVGSLKNSSQLKFKRMFLAT